MYWNRGFKLHISRFKSLVPAQWRFSPFSVSIGSEVCALRRHRAGRLGSQVLRVLLDLFWVICVALVRHYFYLIRSFLLFTLNVFLLSLDVYGEYHKRQVLLRVPTIFLFRDRITCVINVGVLNKNWLSRTTNFQKKNVTLWRTIFLPPKITGLNYLLWITATWNVFKPKFIVNLQVNVTFEEFEKRRVCMIGSVGTSFFKTVQPQKLLYLRNMKDVNVRDTWDILSANHYKNC